MSPSLRARLQADLPAALRSRDRARVAVLRTTLAALANAEAVDSTASATDPAVGLFAAEVGRRELSEHDVRGIVVAARDELRLAAAELHRLDQPERAGHLGVQADILDAYVAS